MTNKKQVTNRLIVFSLKKYFNFETAFKTKNNFVKQLTSVSIKVYLFNVIITFFEFQRNCKKHLTLLPGYLWNLAIM